MNRSGFMSRARRAQALGDGRVTRAGAQLSTGQRQVRLSEQGRAGHTDAVSLRDPIFNHPDFLNTGSCPPDNGFICSSHPSLLILLKELYDEMELKHGSQHDLCLKVKS